MSDMIDLNVGEIRVLDDSGDTRIEWNSHSREEVDAARNMFDSLIKKGYSAYSVKRGLKDELITRFDPALEMIVMTPRIVGG